MWRSSSRFRCGIRSPQFSGVKPGTLRREIVVVVLVKLALLVLLKVAFFSAPPPNGPEMQAQHLLSDVASPASITRR